MPNLTVAGDVFQLGADGEFDGRWYSSGRLRGEAGLRFEGRAVLCHGLDVAVAAEAAAEIEGALTVFLPTVRVEGRAFASAGAGVTVQVSPNIFEKVGLTIDAKAFAQASVAGRIALGLDFTEIARLAEEQLPSIAYDIFIAFLNELVIEAGVWGRASFAAMAEAHLEINGTVIGDDAGFQIAAGAGVAWAGGTAWDFYGRLGMENPRRFYTTAVELMVRELSVVARRELGPEHAANVELLELIAPIASLAAYDLGEMAAEELLRPADQSVAPFLEAFLQRLALYILDKLVGLAEEMVAQVITDALSALADRPLSAQQRLTLRAAVDELVDIVGEEALSVDSALVALAPIVTVLEVLVPDDLETWENELTVMWSAAAVGSVLRRSATRAGVSLSFLGGGVSAGVSLLDLPEPPPTVRRVYDRHFDPGPATITFGDTVDYLSDLSFGPLLELLLPDVANTVGQVASAVGVSTGDVITAALIAAVGDDLSTTDLYVQVRDFTKGSIDGALVVDLLPALKAAIDDPDLVRYVDEVIEPVLLATSGFLFSQLDEMVAGVAADVFDPFNQTFKAGLGELVWLTFARNVVFASDVLLNHALDALDDGFRALETDISGNPGHAMVEGAVELASDTFGAFNPLREDHVEAVRLLVADLVGAGASAFGPSIWTFQRRERLRTLTRSLLEHGDLGAYSNPTKTAKRFEELADCFFVPDEDSAIAMLRELADLTGLELAVIGELVMPAFELFFLRLTVEILEDIERVAIAFIAAIADAVRAAWEILQEINILIVEALDDLAELGATADEELDALASTLAGEPWRKAILDGLQLEAMDAASATASSAPGFDSLPLSAQASAIAAARGTADIAFGLVRPILNLGLLGTATALDGLGDVIETSASAPAAVVDAADLLGQAVKDGVVTALADAGVALPPGLTVDLVEAMVIEAVTGVTGVRLLLEHYIAARQAELEADADLQRLEDDRARAENEWQRQRQQQEGLVGETGAIEIMSPGPISVGDAENWMYPRSVPVFARLRGARPSYVHPESPTRILVALNGQPIPILQSAWSYNSRSRALELRTTIETGLVSGTNTLEISVVDTGTDPVRAAVTFLADPTLEPSAAKLIVDSEASRFDTSGDDHTETPKEFVALRNTGDEPLSLEGFRLWDRARHMYVFGARELFPGDLIRLHTGPGRNSRTDLYWGRSRAIWNNRGDTVYVADSTRVLVTELVY